MKALVFTLMLTGCTIKIIDDTADYDVQGYMRADGCEIELKRIEAKTRTKGTVQ